MSVHVHGYVGARASPGKRRRIFLVVHELPTEMSLPEMSLSILNMFSNSANTVSANTVSDLAKSGGSLESTRPIPCNLLKVAAS